MVSAGLCAASWVCPVDTAAGEANAAARGLYINFWFGDYIEAAYPLMERDRYVNAAAYLAASISGGILGSVHGGVRSSAYLPAPLAVAIAGSEWREAFVAFAVCFFLPFAVALSRNSAMVVAKE